MAKKRKMAKMTYSSRSKKQTGVWRTIASWYTNQDTTIKTGIFTALLIIIATPVIITTAINGTFHARSPDIAMLVVTPSSQSFHKGDTISYEIHENSCNIPISEIRLNVTYATSKLTLQNIDFTNSVFENQDEYIAQNGLIQIGRSSSSPVTGDQFVLKATFNAIDDSSSDTNALSINSGSSVSDTTGTNTITTKTVVVGQQGAQEEMQLPTNCPTTTNHQETFLTTIQRVLGNLVSPVLQLF